MNRLLLLLLLRMWFVECGGETVGVEGVDVRQRLHSRIRVDVQIGIRDVPKHLVSFVHIALSVESC